jgi:4'-phosphopantetheinyl transferase EntD
MNDDQGVSMNMRMHNHSANEDGFELDAPEFQQRRRDRRTERRTARRAARQLVKLVGRARLDRGGHHGDDQAS